MGTLVVGDLHGKLHHVKQALESPHNVVFVGDYLDSYDLDVAMQLATLDNVLDAIENEGDRVQGLFGNHEMSYLMPHMRCSGYNAVTDVQLITRTGRMHKLLKFHTRTNGFLITHAGVSKRFLVHAGYNSVDEYLDSFDFEDIGVVRGGYSGIGGLLWCDWRHEFDPIADVPQIVGHTRNNHIRRMGNSYCIDVLDNYNPRCLLLQDDQVFVWNLDANEIDSLYNIVEEET